MRFHFPVLGLLCFGFACVGCIPTQRLHFPEAPTHRDGADVWYDTNRDELPDFALTHDNAGRLDTIGYDDDQDGTADRQFRLSDYAAQDVPHLIVLLDAIPYRALRDAIAARPAGVWGAFYEPAKVIAPYPSMSALCFSAILQAPPMPGPVNRHYDPRPQVNGVNNLIVKRFAGYRNPWQQRLHYNIQYTENGDAFLRPRPWMKVEFERARRALDRSPDRTTIVYISSTAMMLAKYGPDGLEEVLDELGRFLLQVLHERRGAVKISLASDHGHNLTDTQWLDVASPLKEAGFRVKKKLKRPDDVFVEMDGLLTWFGVYTSQPVAVSNALLGSLPQLETVAYMDGYDVVIRDHNGQARVAMVDGRLTYTPETSDVLGYGEELSGVALGGDAWFERTADHRFPDGPTRLWEAFHGRTVHAPQVMATLKDGYCAGIGWFTWFIKMRSTHGGLNQVNSAAMVMTMTRPIDGPLRSGEVVEAIEPGFVPRIVSPAKR